MASNSGTSVLGHQQLSYPQVSSETAAQLYIDFTNTYPRAVGYVYFLSAPNAQDNMLLFAKGLIYRPGVEVPLLPTHVAGVTRLSIYANWKVAGLPWQVFF